MRDALDNADAPLDVDGLIRGLTPAQRATWDAALRSLEPEFYSDCDKLGLLHQYVLDMDRVHLLRQKIAVFEGTTGELRVLDDLLDRTLRRVLAESRALRLCPSARYDKLRAATAERRAARGGIRQSRPRNPFAALKADLARFDTPKAKE